MQFADLVAVVQVHIGSFPGFFLTFLGPSFLRELYAAIIADPSGIAFVWEQEQQIAGFVAGADQPAGLYTRLLRQRWWRFGLAALLPALRSPSIVPRLARALGKPGETVLPERMGTLMSIAVLPEKQGQGIGQTLVHAFLDESRRRGLDQINLTTDAVGNEATNQFYRRLGFRCVRSFTTPEGREMNEYVIDLIAE